MKKVAIVSPYRRIVLDNKTIRSLESKYIQYYLQHIKKYGVSFISKTLKNENEMTYYIDINDADLDDYDEIYLHNAQINLFGGKLDLSNITLIKKLLDYKKPIYSIITDPRILLYNYVESLLDRKDYFKTKNKELYDAIKEWDDSTIEKFKNLNFITAFCGTNYELFKKTIKHKKNKFSIIPKKYKFGILVYIILK